MAQKIKQLPKHTLASLNQLKDILPLVWDSYVHMREVRKNGVDNFRNFLLIIISFLPLIALSLFDTFKQPLFFLPIIIQLISFLLLIKTFFINEPQIPWINPDNFLEQIDNKQFEANLFINLKALENDTFSQLKETGKYITLSLYLLLFSLYTLVLGVFFIYFNSNVLYLLVILLTIGLVCLYRFYQKQIKYETDQNRAKYAKQLEGWLNKK